MSVVLEPVSGAVGRERAAIAIFSSVDSTAALGLIAVLTTHISGLLPEVGAAQEKAEPFCSLGFLRFRSAALQRGETRYPVCGFPGRRT